MLSDPLDHLFGNDGGDSRAVRARREIDIHVAVETAQLVNDWLSVLGRCVIARTFGLNSLRNYQRAVRPWLLYLETHHIAQPTSATVTAFLRDQADHYRVNTVNSRRDALVALYRWAAGQGQTADLTSGVARLVREAATLPPEASADNLVEGFLTMMGTRDFTDLRNRVIISFIGSGLETVSVRSVLMRDLDVKGSYLRFQPRRHKQKDAIMPLRPVVLAAVTALMDHRRTHEAVTDDTPLITPSYNREIPLSTLSMRLLVRRLADSLGIGRGQLTTTALRCAGVGALSRQLGVARVARCTHQARGSLRRVLGRL